MSKPPSKARAIKADQAALLMAPLTDLVMQAGLAILAVNRRAMKIEGKLDGSPVTEADLAADHIIGNGLARLVPHVPALSEERIDQSRPPYRGSFFLIDPLDGTKEFVAGRDEFTVNLALVANGTPLLGIIGAPALGWLWRGLVGRGAERLRLTDTGAGTPEPIRTRPTPKQGEPWIAAVSRSHGDDKTEAFIASRPGAIREKLGSAVKFGRVAEGAADIYPRLSPTSEWDVAAGHALVTAAGGKVTDAHGEPLRFGAGNGTFVMPAFIAWGDPAAAARPY
jgi:3'(2'), 5'-bisphosphate nucleotidase